jgi:hypothetical protein
METNAINKIEAFFRRGFFNALLAGTITPVLSAAAFVSGVSLLVDIDGGVWVFLICAVIFKFAYIFGRAAFYKIDRKECYRELDKALDLKERSITCYETFQNKTGGEDGSRAAVLSLVREDFIKNYQPKSYIFSDDKEFDRVFTPCRAAFGRRHYYISSVIIIFSLLNIYLDYNAAAGRADAVNAEAEKKEVPKDAAKVLDALIESGGDKLKAADAVAELRQAREKLKEPQTSKELAKNLKEAAEKLKRIQQGENKKGALSELAKINEAADEMVSGRAGEGLNEDDKKMVEEKVREFKKLVDDYLKSSNDKDFAKIEKEIAELTSLLEAKKEALKKAAADKKAGGQKDGQGQAGKKEMSAEEKSAMKHMDRMSGKELLEKLKNDKQLQEMYAALSAMSAEAESGQKGSQPNDKGAGGEGGEGDGKKDGEGKNGGKEGKEGKDGKGGDGKISAESLGINIPKPGKGSSNLKAESGDAPLMAPQDRQKAGQAEKKAGQWKAFFEAERFGVDAKKSKVEGLHDAKAPSMSIEGKSLPEPGTADAAMEELVRSEKSGADSLVSGDDVPDELKKPVADYFKKLNNDFDQKKP